MNRFLIIVPPAIAVLGLFLMFGHLATADDPPPELEGLPMPFTLVSVEPVAGGNTRVVYRSAPFIPTLSEDPDLLHDEGYEGQMGTHGGVRWINVPEGHAITVFPFRAQSPATPSWQQTLENVINEHPDLHVISHVCQHFEWYDNQWEEVPVVQKIPHPGLDCDPAGYAGFAIEYRVVIGGNLTGIEFPQQADHYLYRIIP